MISRRNIRFKTQGFVLLFLMMMMVFGCAPDEPDDPWSSEQLTAFGSGPVFSPDGTKIVFGGDDGLTLGVWIYDLSEGLSLLWEGTSSYDFAWSPNSDKVTFSEPGGNAPELLAVELDGTVTSIADNGRNPDWSPDGTMIVYQDGLGTGLYLSASAGGGTPAIINTNGQTPQYSPNGDNIAYVTDAGAYPKLYVYNIASNTSAYLVVGGLNFSWAPGSDRIVFDVFDVNGPSVIKATDLLNPYPEVLWQGGTDPAYAQGSSKIVYRSLSGFAGSGIFTMSDNGGAATRVSVNGYFPSFGSNDGIIAYSVENNGIWLATKN